MLISISWLSTAYEFMPGVMDDTTHLFPQTTVILLVFIMQHCASVVKKYADLSVCLAQVRVLLKWLN